MDNNLHRIKIDFRFFEKVFLKKFLYCIPNNVHFFFFRAIINFSFYIITKWDHDTTPNKFIVPFITGLTYSNVSSFYGC